MQPLPDFDRIARPFPRALALRRGRSFFASALLFVALLSAAVSGAYGQGNPPPPDASISTIRVNARSVVVNVVVTDKAGRPVKGLPEGQFKIFQDGKAQAVTSFEEHSGVDVPSDAHAPATAAPPVALPANTFSNASVAPSPDSINILLMDALNTPVGDQATVHKQMVRFMATISQGTPLAVFTLSERLRLIQGMTTDIGSLRAAIDSTASNPNRSASLPSRAEDAANRNAVGSAETAGGGSAQQGQTADALRQFLDQQATFALNERIRYTLDALNEIARYLAGVPGRKNLIWFAGSIPLCVFASHDCPYEDQVGETIDLLASSQIALYPIDAAGLSPGFTDDASAPPNHDLDLNLRQGSSAGQAATAAQVGDLTAARTARIGNQTTMDELAKQTGGQAVYNTNDLLGALRRDIDNGAHYYTIAYTPPHESTGGKAHSIRVRLAEGKYNLAYRRSYADSHLNAGEASNDPLSGLMSQGMPESAQLIYRAHVASESLRNEVRPEGDNPAVAMPATRYSVNFVLGRDGLDPDKLVGANLNTEVEVALVAYSREGKPLNWETRSLTLSLTPEQYESAKQNGIPFTLRIDAPKGVGFLRTGVYDAGSHKAGTLEIDLASLAAATPVMRESQPADLRTAIEPAPVASVPPTVTTPAAPPSVAHPGLVVAPSVEKVRSVVFWSLGQARIHSMLLDPPLDNRARYNRLHDYFEDLGCGRREMQEVPVGRSGQRNLVCTLAGKSSRRIVVAAHYESSGKAEAGDRNWAGAIMLVMLYKALQAEQREHTFVFVEEWDREGEKAFQSNLSSAPTAVAGVALDIRGPDPLFFQLSWNALAVMLRDAAGEVTSDVMDSVRGGEVTKARMAYIFAQSAQLNHAPVPQERKANRTVGNARLLEPSTEVPSILIYSDPQGKAPMRKPDETGGAKHFDLLAEFLCALDHNLVVQKDAVALRK